MLLSGGLTCSMPEETKVNSLNANELLDDQGAGEFVTEGHSVAQTYMDDIRLDGTFDAFDGPDNFPTDASFLGNGSYSALQNVYSPSAINYDLNRHRYDEFSAMDNEMVMGGHYGDPSHYSVSSRPHNTLYGTFDRGYDGYSQFQSPTSDVDPFSPRSRYDLAYPTKSSRFSSSQWDDSHGGFYDQLSPRYKAESRWMDRDVNFSLYDDADYHFSPSLRDRTMIDRHGYLPDGDISNSYTYGMHQSRHRSGSSAVGGYPSRGYDGAYEDIGFAERTRHPFSDPSSPQPMMASPFADVPPAMNFSHVTQARAFPRHPTRPMQHDSSPSAKFSVDTASVPQSPRSMQTGGSTAAPTAAAGVQSAAEDAGTEKGEAGDDSYRIDSQLIMQNQENRTVVLIRNIPNRYKLEDLEQVISAHVDGRGGTAE